MIARRILLISGLLSIAAPARSGGVSQPLQAAPCSMPALASLDVETTSRGMIVLPATVDGHRGGFLLDTGGMVATIGWSTAKQLNNSPYLSNIAGQLTGGTVLGAGVTVERFELGPLTFERVGFLVAPDRMLPGNEMGIFQPHSITHINYEIDFVKGKVNLFRQGACPDRDVYWTQSVYAKVPMDVDFRGHIFVKAALDGKPVRALIDTGAQTSTITYKTSKSIFGIDEKNAAIKSLGSKNVNNLADVSAWSYPFQSLNFEGIAISHPNIVIMDAGATDTDEAEIVVGIGELRHFHLFIAYDENALYLTPAESY